MRPHYSNQSISCIMLLFETQVALRTYVLFSTSHAKLANSTSLNDHLLVGRKLQQNLPGIVARWHQWRYVYIADIAKMFRQILIKPVDVDFQRILWRPIPESSLQHFRLRTVTYSLAPAPYLAMRVLKQLAIDDGHLFPAAIPIVESSIYVDDTLFGNDNVHELREYYA
ncbi:hypothetical protein HN011_009107 [Eciton burchellii]|nr:hypothetical protein HN011_009107 [Eciton burchellii]